jgi:hypothetical protein
MMVLVLTLTSCNKPTTYDDGRYNVIDKDTGEVIIVAWTNYATIKKYDNLICIDESGKDYMMCYDNARLERID